MNRAFPKFNLENFKPSYLRCKECTSLPCHVCHFKYSQGSLSSHPCGALSKFLFKLLAMNSGKLLFESYWQVSMFLPFQKSVLLSFNPDLARNHHYYRNEKCCLKSPFWHPKMSPLLMGPRPTTAPLEMH